MKELLAKKFENAFKEKAEFYVSNGGRFEVIGNHTDHNHGMCIAGTCSLSIYSASNKRNDSIVTLISERYEPISVDLNSLEIDEKERNTNNALIRGIAYYLNKNGYKVGGMNIYMMSTIPSGAGVSSSAAFELLIAYLFNIIYNNGNIERLLLCQAGQYAERYYYGKMCGLLDQIGVGYGGYTFMDFEKDPPKIESIKVNMDGYSFVIVNTGGSHAELSDLYTQIPNDMNNVARVCSKNFLRDVPKEEVIKRKEEFNKREFNRAMHFYGENERVLKALNSLKRGDIEELIKLINKTRESCTNLLKNMCVDDQIKGSPLEACQLIDKASENKAGVKINGGGFAGSVIALMPNEIVEQVCTVCKERYGNNNVHIVSVRNEGPMEF